MNERETELLDLIRSSADALKVALELMIDFLKKPAAPQGTASESPRETA